MKLVTFSTGSDQHVGVVDADRDVVRDVSPLLPEGTGVLQLIERWAELGPLLERQAAGQPEQPLDGVRLLAPIPVPRRDIFAVGKNHREHAVEFGPSGYDSPDPAPALPQAPVAFPHATTSATRPLD